MTLQNLEENFKIDLVFVRRVWNVYSHIDCKKQFLEGVKYHYAILRLNLKFYFFSYRFISIYFSIK